MHVSLFFFGVRARESSHDWLSPITRQEKITWRKCPTTWNVAKGLFISHICVTMMPDRKSMVWIGANIIACCCLMFLLSWFSFLIVGHHLSVGLMFSWECILGQENRTGPFWPTFLVCFLVKQVKNYSHLQRDIFAIFDNKTRELISDSFFVSIDRGEQGVLGFICTPLSLSHFRLSNTKEGLEMEGLPWGEKEIFKQCMISFLLIWWLPAFMGNDCIPETSEHSRCAVTITVRFHETKGAFHLLELASRTISEPVILTMKSAFSKGFCWRTISFLYAI